MLFCHTNKANIWARNGGDNFYETPERFRFIKMELWERDERAKSQAFFFLYGFLFYFVYCKDICGNSFWMGWKRLPEKKDARQHGI